MKLKVDKSESYDWSIVVDEKELRRLDEIIKDAFGDSQETTLKYNIKCSDGSLIETDDINEVVSEENPKNHQIEYITVNTENPKFSKKIYISLGKKDTSSEKSVSYSISGDTRDWVYLTASKIEERVKNLKTWYSLIPKSDLSWVYMIIGLIAFVYLNDISKSIITKYPSISQDTAGIVIILIIIGILYTTYQLTKKGYPYLFPSVVFRIGDGIKRHDDVVKLRGQIFWGIIISFVVSLIAGLMILLYTS
ncbi:MAG: hypothetical protein O8C62_07780 [Candidatus Methanoperedens sp.]|nr:hypothetical protein [Candidatus Methanoperedens sp.]